MKLQALEVRSWRGLEHLRLEEFHPRLNVIQGPNESGKSRLVEALYFALFHRHQGEAKAKRRLQTWNAAEAPEVSVRFEIGDQEAKLDKRFLFRSVTQLTIGRETWSDNEAEQQLEKVLQASTANRLGPKVDQLGVWRLLFVSQGQAPYSPHEDLNRSERSKLQTQLARELEALFTNPIDEAVLAEAEAAARRFWTQQGKPTGDYRKSLEQLEYAQQAFTAADQRWRAARSLTLAIATLRDEKRDLEAAYLEAQQLEAESRISPQTLEEHLQRTKQRSDYERLLTKVTHLEQTRARTQTALESLQQNAVPQLELVALEPLVVRESLEHPSFLQPGDRIDLRVKPNEALRIEPFGELTWRPPATLFETFSALERDIADCDRELACVRQQLLHKPADVPETTQSRLRQNQESIRRVQELRDKLQAVEQRIERLHGELTGMQAQEIDEHRVQEEEALARAQREHRRIERQAKAARLLLETLRDARARRIQRLALPLEQRAHELLGKLSFVAGLRFNDDWSISGRTRDARTEPFEELSFGTREQLSLVARVAFINLLAGDHSLPLVLDESLVHSDPERRNSMIAELVRTTKHVQFLVFSSQPIDRTVLPEHRFFHLGTRLEESPS